VRGSISSLAASHWRDTAVLMHSDAILDSVSSHLERERWVLELIIFGNIQGEGKTLLLFSLSQIVDSSTRITRDSASLLDLIMLSSNIDVVEAGVDDLAHISDHLTVFTCLALAGSHRVI